jgi:hypothetical protein
MKMTSLHMLLYICRWWSRIDQAVYPDLKYLILDVGV